MRRASNSSSEDRRRDGDADEARGIIQVTAILGGMGPSISGWPGGGSSKDDEKAKIRECRFGSPTFQAVGVQTTNYRCGARDPMAGVPTP